MENIHHKPIKAFTFTGIIKDEAAIGRLKQELIRLKNLEMREDGYSQRLDIEPDFTIQYIEQQECFEFTLTVYGTYLGKKKALWTTGIDGTLVVPIAKNKLKRSLLGLA